MTRIWIWWQLLFGWLPIWALYTTLIAYAHPEVPVPSAVFSGFRAVLCAAVLGFGVHRFTARRPWPRPMRTSFIAQQAMASVAFAVCWLLLSSALDALLTATHGAGPRAMVGSLLIPFLVVGVWMYVMVAGVSYASQATERAAVAEALAARSQLDVLRSQLNPHFLFNALHSVVQLIALDPRRATHAAEDLAGLLRASLEETRDLIPLADEWAFVQRYVALEQMRFGDRLQLSINMDADAPDALVPSFSLQTLVENAIRHGAAPRVEPTAVRVHASVTGGMLTVGVCDDGVGMDGVRTGGALTITGTGLTRLRDRLRALFGDSGTLMTQSVTGEGFRVTMVLPFRDGVPA